MYLININNSYHYEMENLIRVFLPDIKIIRAEEIVEGEDYCLLTLDVNKVTIELSLGEKIYKCQLKATEEPLACIYSICKENLVKL